MPLTSWTPPGGTATALVGKQRDASAPVVDNDVAPYRFLSDADATTVSDAIEAKLGAESRDDLLAECLRRSGIMRITGTPTPVLAIRRPRYTVVTGWQSEPGRVTELYPNLFLTVDDAIDEMIAVDSGEAECMAREITMLDDNRHTTRRASGMSAGG